MSKDEQRERMYHEKALKYARYYGGKVSLIPKVPISSLEDFSLWYTPGVAAVSDAIHSDNELSFELTNRWNTIAILTDGSRVLGLGNVGPEASLPVMEGKALIYKYFGGVDAVPLPIRSNSTEEFISIAQSVEPSFGGINLEDIESPRCFEILESLRNSMEIPVWHDDQQGTAGVVLAALFSAIELTDREISKARITLLGAGAANLATARLLIEAGFDPNRIILVDSKGTLHPEREDMDQLMLRNKWKYELALKTNGDRIKGGLKEALRDADVLIAASTPGPNVVREEHILAMSKEPIVFLLANPVPEMWPEDAKRAGAAVVATGRSDYPNQVNNSLLFPSVFRGCLDVRARTISDTMVIEASKELALYAKETGINENRILPSMVEWEFYPRVAARIGLQAQKEGIARKKVNYDELLESATNSIKLSRRTLEVLMEENIIRRVPD
jgi:malate dehydrogenase (oxaloacetate-decarboxylating)